MSRYGEHSTGLAKFKIFIGNPQSPISSKPLNPPAPDWLTSNELTLADINKHPITKK